MTKGLLTASKVLVLNGGTDMLWEVSFYDDLGRNTRQISQHYKGGVLTAGNYDETVNTHGFTNELLTSVRSHKINGAEQLNIKTTFDYDHVGRMINTWQSINNGDNVLLAKNEYNELGQLKTKLLHSTTGGTQASESDVVLGSADVVASGQQRVVTASNSITLADGFEAKAGSTFKASITGRAFLQTIRYVYNERGWLTQINDPDAISGTEAFGMKLSYNDHQDPDKKQFNGNISGVSWQSKVPAGLGFTQELQRYDYGYDNLNRLKLADYVTVGKSGHFNEALSYDLMGNITSLERKSAGSVIDQLAYSYQNGNKSNRLSSITDNSGNNAGLVAGVTAYSYDDNGNLITDDRKALNIQYNLLNLPNLIKKTTTNESITYIYDATGRKLRKVTAGSSRDYIDGIEYDNAGNLEFFLSPEGRVVKNGSTYSYEYMLKDHLGNTRSVVKQDGSILQVPDYYAFGMELNHNTITPSPDNRYKYNGKEMQPELGLGQLDYGARFYDPVIGRWNVMDRKAEVFVGLSPYNYVLNNPISFTDPDGEAPSDPPTFLQKLIAYFGVLWNQPRNADQAYEYSQRQRALLVSNKKIEDGANYLQDKADWAPFIGAAMHISKGGVYHDKKEAGLGFGLGMLDVFGGKLIGKGAKALRGVGKEILEKVITKVGNIAEHLTNKDMTGAIRDIFKDPVIINGKQYDHLGEVNDALKGLGNQIEKLNKEIRNGNFSEDVLEQAEKLRSSMQKEKDRIQDILNKAINEQR